MSGHSKWAQIKRQKASTDAKKSKVFTKHARLIANEAKKSGGLINASVASAIENAKKDNVPKDVIERAIKKGGESPETLEQVTYECYGPGGCAIIIEALSGNRNKTAQEIKHILSENNTTLATPGSASWAFTKEQFNWTPTMTVELSDTDLDLLGSLVDALEEHEDVQEVFSNVQ